MDSSGLEGRSCQSSLSLRPWNSWAEGEHEGQGVDRNSTQGLWVTERGG